MKAIYNSYPDQLIISYIDESGDKKIVKFRIYKWKDGEIEIKRKESVYPEYMWREDKNNTVDKLSSKTQRMFMKRIYQM